MVTRSQVLKAFFEILKFFFTEDPPKITDVDRSMAASLKGQVSSGQISVGDAQARFGGTEAADQGYGVYDV